MNTFSRSLCLLTLGLSTASILTGCGADTSILNGNPASVTLAGNWQVSSPDAQAAKLPVLAGSLTNSGAKVTATLHVGPSSLCAAPDTPVTLTGNLQENKLLQLTGAFQGGTVVVNGTLADDNRSLTDASYIVKGGGCGFDALAAATAVRYEDLSGTFDGILNPSGGGAMQISSSFTQVPMNDGSGYFKLQGTAHMPSGGCLGSTFNITSSRIMGQMINVTYTDGNGNSVAWNGTFSADGTGVGVNAWKLTGSCGSDVGTGFMTRE